MNFIDHTGHIFSLQDYTKKPIGYEYDVNDYIFWLDSEFTHQLSVNNYYMLPIRLLLNKDVVSIEIIIENSEYYKLFSTKQMHELVSDMKSLYDYITISEDSLTSTLYTNDLVGIESENYNIIPFYVLGNSDKEGTIITNILIHTIDKQNEHAWCPISVGGTYYDTNEALIINGKNMGVNLPKEILGAIYQYSYKSDSPDETLYANKIKEYLLSYMHIKGQIGNFNSILDSLKWFGYGDKIEIQKLLQTDNQFQDQFFLDDFTIHTNILHSYAAFRHSTYISLRLWDNEELDVEYQQQYSINNFWGEGKPILENLFDKTIIKHYDEGDLDFYRSYYDWCFEELGLKLAMLDYYFKKFFMPIHLHIHSTTIAHRVFANDIKMINIPSVHQQEKTVITGYNNVRFENTSNYYIYNQEFYVDTNFNNFIYTDTNITESYYKRIGNKFDEDILYINQPCVRIPIFINENGYHNCHLILLKDDKPVLENHFDIIQTDNIKYDSLIVLPKYINDSTDDNLFYWLESDYKIAFLCDDKWYYHKFNIRMPEMQLNFGILEYKYCASMEDIIRIDLNDPEQEPNRHKWGYEYDREKWGADTPDIDIRYIFGNNSISLHKQLNRLDEGEIDFNAFMYVPSLVEVNDINFYDKLQNAIVDTHGSIGGMASVSNKGGNSQVGILTKKKLIEQFKNKSRLTNFTNYNIDKKQNIDFDETGKKYFAGDTIYPQCYFNDYSRDDEGNIIEPNYKIKNFTIDITIGSFNINGEEAMYVTKTLDVINDGIYNTSLFDESKYGLLKPIAFKFSDWHKIFQMNECELLVPNYTDEIEAAKKSMGASFDLMNVEAPFKILECMEQENKDHLTLRFVWNIQLECEDTFKKSYDNSGYPLADFSEEITINLEGADECKMKDCFLMKYKSEKLADGTIVPLRCKYKKYKEDYIDIVKDYDNVQHEFFGEGDDVQQAIEQTATEQLNQLITENIKSATTEINIANNKEYINRIHIYNIYFGGYSGKINSLWGKDETAEFNTDIMKDWYTKTIFDQISSDVPLMYNKNKYGDYTLSSTEWDEKYKSIYKVNLYQLYSLFFSEPDGEQLVKYPVHSSYFDYDFYLMHDDTNWYVVFISQLPVAYANKPDLEAPKEIEYIDPHGYKFIMKHYRSGNNFLINRMYFRSAEGVNQFDKKDLIVGTIDNVKFPFIVDQGSKWNIVPYSLGIDPDACVSNSNANTCIFSIGRKNQTYVSGYYDINVRYSIDGNVQHQQMATGRIKIV